MCSTLPPVPPSYVLPLCHSLLLAYSDGEEVGLNDASVMCLGAKQRLRWDQGQVVRKLYPMRCTMKASFISFATDAAEVPDDHFEWGTLMASLNIDGSRSAGRFV